MLRLWITSVKQYSFEADHAPIALEPQQATTPPEKSKEQFTELNNQDKDNKTTILKEMVESLNSDEFVNAYLNIGTITLILLAILFPLLNFRNQLYQRQQKVTQLNERATLIFLTNYQ